MKSGLDGSSDNSSVTEEKKTTATIYYSNANFKSAYIHYRTGNGTWTKAPGMQMCNDSEQS